MILISFYFINFILSILLILFFLFRNDYMKKEVSLFLSMNLGELDFSQFQTIPRKLYSNFRINMEKTKFKEMLNVLEKEIDLPFQNENSLSLLFFMFCEIEDNLNKISLPKKKWQIDSLIKVKTICEKSEKFYFLFFFYFIVIFRFFFFIYFF